MAGEPWVRAGGGDGQQAADRVPPLGPHKKAGILVGWRPLEGFQQGREVIHFMFLKDLSG